MKKTALEVIEKKLLKKYTVLSLAKYKFENNNLPIEISKLVNLKKLNLSYCKLVDINLLSGLINLHYLDLYKNNITDISPIFNMCNLIELFLGYNKILNIKGISKLIKLQCLILFANEISDIDEITNLINLRQIGLSGNKIKSINGISKLINLEYLHLSYNEISDISELSNLINLKFLDLTNNKILDIEIVSKFTNLEELYVSRNKISNIDSLAKLVSLKRLNLSFNKITNIKAVSQLIGLEYLNLDNIELVDISIISKLVNLTQLCLLGSKLLNADLIVNFINLKKISLDFIYITDMEPLASMNSLKEIHIGGIANERTVVEKFVEKFEEYNIELYFDFLYIKNIPISRELTKDPKITCKNLAQYFRKLKKESQENLIFGKLMLLGMPAVGKTSLYKKLIDPNIHLDFQEAGTHSMNIGEWEFDYTNPRNTPTHEGFDGKFRTNILDFGGDEILQPTHRYFMREDCVYAILVNPREQEQVDWFYWLSSIRQYGGEKSPIFIIFNNKENQHYAGQLPASVQDLGFNIQDVFNVDLKTNLGLAELSQVLQTALQNLSGVGDAIPKSWATMQKNLAAEAQKQPYIDFDTFEQIYSRVETYEEKTPENTCQLAKILDNFNRILYFPDKPKLAETLILRTEWATRAAYKIYWDVPTKNAFGAFERKDLKRILAPKNPQAAGAASESTVVDFLGENYVFPSDKYDFLLNLMETFGIAYEVGKTANYIVPALLSEQRPANALLPLFNTNEPQAFYRFKIRFPKLMPKGIIPLFIVRQHTQIFEQAQWKTGVLLRINQPNAYVEVQERRAGGTQEIECTIKTQAPKEAAKKVYENLLGEVLKEIDPHKNLGYELWIACPCDVCKTSKEPHFYKYADLEKREKAGKREVECNVSYQDLHVRDLLLDLDKGGYSGNEMDFFKKKARQDAQKEFVATGFEQLGGKIVETVKIGFTTFLETFLANIQTLKQTNKDEETLIVEIQESIDADAQIAQESETYAQALQTLIPESDKLNTNSRKYLQTGLYLENSGFLQNNAAYSVATLQFCRAVEQEMMTLIEGFKAWVQLKPETQTLKGYEKDLYDELLKFINSPAHFHISFGYLCGFLEYALPDKSTYALRKTSLFKAFVSFLDTKFDRRKHDALFIQMIKNIILLKKGDYRNKSAHIGEITTIELNTCKDLVINILRNFTDSKK